MAIEYPATLLCYMVRNELCDPICKNPTFSKVEIFVSWCSSCLKPSSLAVSSL